MPAECTPLLVVADGVNCRILLPGCDAAMRKSELLTEDGVVASSSMTKRLHGAPLSRGFISSSSSSLYATVVVPPAPTEIPSACLHP